MSWTNPLRPLTSPDLGCFTVAQERPPIPCDLPSTLQASRLLQAVPRVIGVVTRTLGVVPG